MTSLAFDFAHAAKNVDDGNEAFYIEPMEFRLDPSLRGAVSKLKMINKDDHDSRIRVDVFERTDGADGAEQRTLTKDVRVDLSEFTLAAGSSREIGITYHGGKKLPRERAYRIVVKQVEDTATAGRRQSLDLRFVYVASVYVTPERAEPKVVVKQVRRASDHEVEVELRNEGRAHQKMSDFRAVIEEGVPKRARAIELTDESRQLLARQNILAGSGRKVLLRLAENETLTAEGPLRVKLIRSETLKTGR